MIRTPLSTAIRISLIRVSLLVGMAALPVARVAAQDRLTTLTPTRTGKIVYGSLDGFTTEPMAMGAILRSLHQQFGERPSVGRVFQVKGSHSMAAFFTVALHGQGDRKRAGMIITSKGAPGRMDVAVITDDEAQFSTSVNPMLGQLIKVWHPDAATPAMASGGTAPPASAGPSSPPMPLRLFSLRDGSASVSLPANWTVLPTSGGGTIVSEGPNGEHAFFGYPFLAMNSNDPQVQQTMRFAQGAGRNTAYAQTTYYPYGGDATRMFVDLLQDKRRRGNLPAAAIQFSSTVKSEGGRCTHVTGTFDGHDGKGSMAFDGLFCVGQLVQGGSYLSTATWTLVPMALASQERATVGAMMQSFNVNMAVVSAQASAIAAPAIAQIHEIGRQAAARSEASNEWLESSMQSFKEHGEAQDRSSQAFSNYILDKSVIQDNSAGGHMTTWSSTADAMVKSNPQRYEYVDTPNFWRGIDY